MSSAAAAVVREYDNVRVDNLRVGKYFDSYTNGSVASVDFHHLGQYCITSSKQLLIVYDALAAKERKVIKCTATGAQLARYTHHDQAILYTGRDGTIHYLCLFDESFLHHFKGHQERVTSLSMNPQNDTFLSASMDGSIRLWDLRTRNAQAETRNTRARGHTCVTFGPKGVVFAASFPDNTVRLFDARSPCNGPFKTFQKLLPSTPDLNIDNISISNSEERMLLSTTGNQLVVVDAYKGHVITGIKRDPWRHGGTRPMAACFTEDSKFVCAGLSNGAIQFWDVHNLGAETRHAKLASSVNFHTKPVSAMQWNPRYKSMVSCGHTTAFWIPQHDKQKSA